MKSSAKMRLAGFLGLVGAVAWCISWTFNAFTEDGTRAVLGLSERGWRRTLDPAIAFFIVTWAGLPRQARVRIGFFVALLGLVAMLVGNLTEFWIGPLFYPDVPGRFEVTDHLGWNVFLSGFTLVPIGLIVSGLPIRRGASRGQSLSVFAGSGILLGVILAAAAMLLLGGRASPVAFVAALFPFGLAWGVLGYDLWRRAA